MSSLHQFTQFLGALERHGWSQERETSRFLVFTPPEAEARVAEDGPFRLFVPRDPAAPGFERALDVSMEALASFYGRAYTSVHSFLIPEAEVIAFRLKGDSFGAGAAPLLQLDALVEHLKRAIRQAAAFVLTGDPLGQTSASHATTYLEDCWFLPTLRGSFIARVALPTGGEFGVSKKPTFWEKAAPRSAVTDAIRIASKVIGERVLADDGSILTEEGYEEVRSTLSIGVLEEMTQIFKTTKDASVDLSFRSRLERQDVNVPSLTRERLGRLEYFVKFARAQTGATFPLDVEGQVVEARRTGRDRSGNLVGLHAMVEGKQELVSFRVPPGSLHPFLSAFENRRPIRVRGEARRLRSQVRIESGFEFVELK